MSFRYQHGDRPLAGYTIKRGVGRGGFGEVYYALSDGGREVALKAIFYNQEIELRGVRQCINLKSPHLVSIFDVRNGDDGTPFVIMEYVTGPSLRDLVRENPKGLGEQKSAYLVREIAKGLAYLHERGIVHRDLKPENIFYEDGYVKIGDYGLSKFINASQQSGQTISVGTVHYMAPEIGSGNYHRGIDTYALGVMLYELLTGEVPYQGDSFGEILMKHLTSEPDLQRVEEPFRSTIRRALAKKPEDRFPNVEALATALLENTELQASVAGFNPASLSQAAQKYRVAPAGEDERAPTSPADAQPTASPPAEAAAAAPEASSSAPRPPLTTSPQPPPVPGLSAEASAKAGPFGPPPFDPDPVEAESMDPLDSTQRLYRVLFVGILSAVGLSVLGADFMGFLVSSCGIALAVYLTEFHLRPRFQISRGIGWQVVAAVLAIIPLALGAEIAFSGAGEEEVPIALIVAVLCIRWSARLRPLRTARICASQAFYALIAGGFLGMFAQEPGFTAAVMGTASLLVNAFSPYAPHSVRGAWRLYRAGKGPRPQPPPVAPRPVRPATTSKSKSAEPPGTLARFFWVFLGCGLLASGICSFVVATGDARPEETLAFFCVGEGLAVLAGFSFYRGIWARRPTFWGRTVRPFMLFTLFGSAVIAATCFVYGPSQGLWSLHDENTAGSLGVLTISTVLFGLLLVLDQLLSQLRVSPTQHLPPHLRPVSPFVRIVYGTLCVMSAFGAVVTFGLAVPGEHRFQYLSVGITLGCFSVFALRQAVRQRRGHLWSGALRPFLVATSVAALGVCAAPFVHSALLEQSIIGGREAVGLLFVGIFALVFGVGVYFLRGPDEVAERPFRDRLRAMIHAPKGSWISSSWSAVGTMLWSLGLMVGFANWLVDSGFVLQLGVSDGAAWVTFLAREGEETAALFVVVGAFCVVAGHVGHGLWRIAQATAAQIALVASVVWLFQTIRQVYALPDLEFMSPLSNEGLLLPLLGSFMGCVFGLLLMIWSPGRRTREVEPVNAETPVSAASEAVLEGASLEKPVLGGKEA